MDIGPGDYVECVNDAAAWHDNASYLVCGCIYVVSEVLVGRVHGISHEPSFGVNLEGWPRLPNGWDQSRFRPIYRPKADAFTHLLTNIPSDLEAV